MFKLHDLNILEIGYFSTPNTLQLQTQLLFECLKKRIFILLLKRQKKKKLY